MVITAFELVVVEFISKSKIATIKEPLLNGNWECRPNYIIGHNSNGEVILNLEIEVIRTKKDKQVSLKTMTSFRLTLATKDFKPSTQADFELFTLFTQIALSHTRAIFLYEMKGTFFDKDLLIADSNESQMRKMKLALGISLN
jgi:hypothetical protein